MSEEGVTPITGNDGQGGAGATPETPAESSSASANNEPAASAAPTEAQPSGEPTGGEGGSDTKPFYQNVPDTWRDDILNGLGFEGDELAKRQNQLGRVSDLPSAIKSLLNAQDKIREGQVSNKLAADASEEQVKEWREANGVPAAADAYDINLGEGVTLNENDTNTLNAIQEVAHEANLTNDQMQAIAGKFFGLRQQDTEVLRERDSTAKISIERSLKDAWGPDHDRNMNILRSTFDSMPEGLSDAIHQMRDAQGNALAYNPEFMNYMLQMKLKADPMATIAPNGDHTGRKGLEARKTELESMMGDRDSAYWKDSKLQEEYGNLLQAEERLSKQNA